MSGTGVTTAHLESIAGIVSAFVSSNAIGAAELPALIVSIHETLGRLAEGPSPQPEPQAPAVPIRKSVTDTHLVCLEDGRTFKSLKRHLRTRYGLSPEQYRTKWGLPADYPMVAPAYARQRSALAHTMNLGAQRRKTPRGKAAATRT